MPVYLILLDGFPLIMIGGQIVFNYTGFSQHNNK
jgi:hypothetical protein